MVDDSKTATLLVPDGALAWAAVCAKAIDFVKNREKTAAALREACN
jgi:hypothetical protein